MSDKVFVTNIQRYCTDDGPGIRTTVFLKGCPLTCKWCHNPETHFAKPQLMQRNQKCFICGKCVEACPQKARTLTDSGIEINRTLCNLCGKCEEICPAGAVEISGKAMSTDEILEVVIRDKPYYDKSGGGLTVSGGECASFPDFTLELLSKAKENGIGCAVETSGYGKREFFEQAIKLGTLFLFDIKEIIPEKHKELCGVDNGLILSNLGFLFENGADVIIRLPLIPGINDGDDDLDLLYDFLKSHEGKFQKAQIMPYHSMGTGKSKALSEEALEIDKALYENKCAKCHQRWQSHLKKYFNLE